ncbi:MAG: DUF975 family protein [Ruminococcus sp.]|nr:DUF975 family protein [Ruminococcus sp.]
MSTERIIRNQAREKLSGNFVLATAGLLTVFALLILILFSQETILTIFNVWDENGVAKEGTELLVSLASLLAVTALIALSPVKNGFLRLCFLFANGKEANYNDLFFYFKKGYFLKTVGFNLILALKKLVKAFLCFLPCIVSSYFTYTLKSLVVLGIISFLLFLFGLTLFIILILKYFISEFIYIDDSNTDFTTIFAVTNHIIKRHRGDVYMLWCSFLPWLGLCFFVLPALYVFPYALTASAVSAKWLLTIYKDGRMI